MQMDTHRSGHGYRHAWVLVMSADPTSGDWFLFCTKLTQEAKGLMVGHAKPVDMKEIWQCLLLDEGRRGAGRRTVPGPAITRRHLRCPECPQLAACPRAWGCLLVASTVFQVTSLLLSVSTSLRVPKAKKRWLHPNI